MCEPRQKNGEGRSKGKKEKGKQYASIRRIGRFADDRTTAAAAAGGGRGGEEERAAVPVPIECFARVGLAGVGDRTARSRGYRVGGTARGSDVERTFR